MRLNSLEKVCQCYINQYNPFSSDNQKKYVLEYTKDSSQQTVDSYGNVNFSSHKEKGKIHFSLNDVKIRIQCLFEATVNLISIPFLELNSRLNLLTNKLRPETSKSLFLELKNWVAKSRFKVHQINDRTAPEVAKKLAKAYMKAVIDPKNGLNEVICIFSLKKAGVLVNVADLALNGVDMALDGANYMSKQLAALWNRA